MNIKSFIDKWLDDLIDAQTMYNKNGAVPDTAPLGGDNRIDGCGGWGDAATIVPWEMYEAYGDIRILKKCYDMMKKSGLNIKTALTAVITVYERLTARRYPNNPTLRQFRIFRYSNAVATTLLMTIPRLTYIPQRHMPHILPTYSAEPHIFSAKPMIKNDILNYLKI